MMEKEERKAKRRQSKSEEIETSWQLRFQCTTASSILPAFSMQLRTMHSHLNLLSRRTPFALSCMLLLLLLCICFSAALTVVSASESHSPDSHSSSDSHSHSQHTHNNDADNLYHLHDEPYRIREHDTGELAPSSVIFRGAIYIRTDKIAPAETSEHLLKPWSREWYFYLLGTITCVSLAALAAGLTVGLVSIDPFDLAVIQSTEEGDCSTQQEIEDLREEKMYATRLAPIVQQHHLLLVTLLILNACANEILPILLDNLVPSYIAVILSVSFVLLFGEILPSSIFTGKNQLKFASALTPLVWFFITILFIIAYPIAKLLDYLLGVEDESRLRRSELKSLIRLQASHPAHGSELSLNSFPGLSGLLLTPHTTLTSSPTNLSTTTTELTEEERHEKGLLTIDEMNMIHGVLEIKDKSVADAMVPLAEVFMLDIDTVLDINQLATILHQGHSRIPVYDTRRENIRGVLLVKRLIVVNPEDRRSMRTIATRWPLLCSPEMSLLDILNLFQCGRSHMAIVCSNPTEMMQCLKSEVPVPESIQVLGVITIEDIIELIIKEEIEDETDDETVKQMLEHGTVVRRRVERLKSLAAKMTAAGKRHLRTTSVAVHGRTNTVVSTSSNILARASLKSPTLTSSASPGVLSPQPSMHHLHAPSSMMTSATSSTSAMLPAAALIPNERTSLSRAATVTYSSLDESKSEEVRVVIPEDSDLTSPRTAAAVAVTPAAFTITAAATPANALPRDDTFTRPIRTPSSRQSIALAPHALPPIPGQDGVTVTAHHHLTPSRAFSSALASRLTLASDRRSLDPSTLSALKAALSPNVSSAAAASLHRSPSIALSTSAPPPRDEAVSGSGSGSSGMPVVDESTSLLDDSTRRK